MRYKLLLLVGCFYMLMGCNKRAEFENFAIEYDSGNSNMTGNVLKILPAETQDVNYQITFDGKYIQDMTIDMIDIPDSMYCVVSQRTYKETYDGVKHAQFHVTVGTINTKPGKYNMRFAAYTQQGLYHEFVQPIEVYTHTIQHVSAATYNVYDSLATDSFSTSGVFKMSQYSMNITPKTGGASNEYVMSILGMYPTGTSFTNVEASIDTTTGWTNLASQNILGVTVTGYGRFIYYPNLNRYKGTIFYQYSTIGSSYEGKATF